MFKAIWSSIVGRKKNEWCCNAMRNFVAHQHDRGFFVYAEHAPRQPEGILFFLCYRAADDDHVFGPSPGSKGCISLATRGTIHYCPQCGNKLVDYYRGRYDEFLDPTLENFPHGTLVETGDRPAVRAMNPGSTDH